MGKKLNCKDSQNSLEALIEFKNTNSDSDNMNVLVKRGKDIIFNQKVTVIIGKNNVYSNVDIIWDDVISEEEYHDLGLFGYYSSNYCKISNSKNILQIDGGDGIMISIIP